MKNEKGDHTVPALIWADRIDEKKKKAVVGLRTKPNTVKPVLNGI
jgi:hypothetical protein